MIARGTSPVFVETATVMGPVSTVHEEMHADTENEWQPDDQGQSISGRWDFGEIGIMAYQVKYLFTT